MITLDVPDSPKKPTSENKEILRLAFNDALAIKILGKPRWVSDRYNSMIHTEKVQ